MMEVVIKFRDVRGDNIKGFNSYLGERLKEIIFIRISTYTCQG